MSGVRCLTCASPISGCTLWTLLSGTVERTAVQHLYFKPRTSGSKRESSLMWLVLLRSTSCCSVLLCFLRYCTVGLKMLFLLCFLCIFWRKVSSTYGAQSCPTLCDPMACGLPGSSAHGISQGRILEWVAISYSMGSAQPKLNKRLLRLLYWLADSLPPEPRGKPINLIEFSTVSRRCQLGT